MDGIDDGYTDYMLRFWREADGSLRATVQDPHSGERRGFTSQRELLHFLTHQLQRFEPRTNKEG